MGSRNAPTNFAGAFSVPIKVSEFFIKLSVFSKFPSIQIITRNAPAKHADAIPVPGTFVCSWGAAVNNKECFCFHHKKSKTNMFAFHLWVSRKAQANLLAQFRCKPPVCLCYTTGRSLWRRWGKLRQGQKNYAGAFSVHLVVFEN